MNKKILLLGFSLLLLFIPKGYSDCVHRELKVTIYMNPNDLFYRCMGFYETVEDEGKEFILQWSFKTYNNSFTVNFSNFDGIMSNGKTSDHGEFDTMGVVTDFYFRNTDIIGGYIDIDMHLKEEEIIINSYELIIVLLVISVISVVILFRKKILEK